jgi:hypothetical protein
VFFSATLASANTFNFSGVFSSDDEQAAFNVVLNSPATITLQSTSAAGGGFPTVLSLFGPVLDNNPPLLAFSDTPTSGDAVLGPFGLLAAGTYLVVLTEQDNTPTGGSNLLDPNLWVDPPSTGNFTACCGNPGPFVNPDNVTQNFTGSWAVTFTSVDAASEVPEPATMLSLLLGLGIVAGKIRRKR